MTTGSRPQRRWRWVSSAPGSSPGITRRASAAATDPYQTMLQRAVKRPVGRAGRAATYKTVVNPPEGGCC
jgi:hypothetical protein